jgi:phosphoserine phosphatase
MSGRDKIVCLFDVDGTLTAPMKASLIFLQGEGAGVVRSSGAPETK